MCNFITAVITPNFIFLFFINYFNYQHYLPYDEPAHLTIEAIQIFLDDILEGSAPVYGGSSYSVR